MDNIEQSLKVSKLLDNIGSNIYGYIYFGLVQNIDEYSSKLEIIMKYVDFFIKNGGINDFKFNPNMQSITNYIFLKNINKVLFENHNNEQIKSLIENKIKSVHKKNNQKYKNGFIDNNIDEKQYGKKNTIFDSDILVFVLPISMYYDDFDKIIEISVHITKLIQNNIISIVSSIVMCSFVYMAKNKIDIEKWAKKIFELIQTDKVKKYLDLEDNANMIQYIEVLKIWDLYLNFRFVDNKVSINLSDDNKMFQISKFTEFTCKNYKLGSDCVNCAIIVYDTLLTEEGNFERCVFKSMLLFGQVVVIGGVLGFLYPLLYKYENIPKKLFINSSSQTQ